MDFKFTTASPIMQAKILLNTLSIEALQIQRKMIVIDTHVRKEMCAAIDKKIELIQELTSLFNNQTSEFCDARQDECKTLTQQIDEVDEPTARYNELMDKFNAYSVKYKELTDQIKLVSERIPPEAMVTNYRVKRNIDSTQTCQEALHDSELI